MLIDVFAKIFKNHMIIVPIIAWAVSQVIKIAVCFVTEKRLVLKKIVSDGGMPSAHTATVVSLAVMCGWTQGFDSAVFAAAMILAIVIMRDAVGVRFESGVNAAAIKKLAEEANENTDDPAEKIRTDNLKLGVGHTPLQVACGLLVAIIVSTLYIVIGDIPTP